MSTVLPVAGPDKRLRWDLQKLYNALDAPRHEKGLSWPQLALELQCTPSQLSGIKRARFAISMVLAMRIVQWLDRPARDFVYAASW
jgi:transcriptional regulator with XRE-family HTH domain